jgi:hypothetical protein
MDSTSRIPLDLRERLNAITAWAFPGRGRFKALANASGISFDSWKGTWHNKQRPTTEMVQFVARAWPQFAFWLATGITDLAHGHQAPEGSENFLETMYRPRAGAEPYFRHMVDMLERRERGEPELPTDLVELRALAVARENDELSARAADSMSDGATLALTVQELDADTQPNVETRTGRLLAELQAAGTSSPKATSPGSARPWTGCAPSCPTASPGTSGPTSSSSTTKGRSTRSMRWCSRRPACSWSRSRARPGVVTGDAHTWTWTTDGRDRSPRQPAAAGRPQVQAPGQPGEAPAVRWSRPRCACPSSSR